MGPQDGGVNRQFCPAAISNGTFEYNRAGVHSHKVSGNGARLE